MPEFGKVCIVGVGLLGGSIARVIKKKHLADEVVGFGRNLKNLELAKFLGVVDGFSQDLGEAVKDADLVIFCSPVGSIIPRLVESLPHLKAGCLLTDVGSVKASIVNAIDELLPERLHFIGSHPIAGSEKTGVEASSDDLFCGARCIVTPTEKSQPEALESLRRFWQDIGMAVDCMSAEEHDLILGAVSHLPHIIAFALINTLSAVKTENCSDVSAFSGKGLKDSSRIAASDPVMWRDICIHNKSALLNLIDEFQASLQQTRSWIEDQQFDSLEDSFRSAQERRINLT
ncbi:MAG: prephenate dehydrogenase/arogenate dehydrogenase family protein [Candidatus Nitrohelix vancouverensis]|uniref:Prephenate dehydrogenase/arogenate dehydrogenase family protein n=1 Tax=Candidatus Nitrohelix vancouverensis TaxID=2705534 RepID=A0A7T0C0Z1_9BACT|nr:MAG: prephenate dehydrogenase/arogenate dehydrogenase family protein [Candidatus Nitrohelix vancouverensis]